MTEPVPKTTTPRTDHAFKDADPLLFGWQVACWNMRDCSRAIEYDLDRTKNALSQCRELLKQNVDAVQSAKEEIVRLKGILETIASCDGCDWSGGGYNGPAKCFVSNTMNPATFPEI